MPTKRLRFLILDAGVIIELSRLGLWDRVVAECDVHVSRIVMGEAAFYRDDAGIEVAIDLAPLENAGTITTFDVTVPAMAAFSKTFDAAYQDRLDAGELESLAHIHAVRGEWLLCSGDHIVYKSLAVLDMHDNALSLEEVLDRLGLSKKLPWAFTKAFRLKCAKEGSVDAIQDRGLKK